MRAGESLPRAHFGEHGLQVLERAAHPFQFGVLELLPNECRAHLVVAEDGAVVALGGFVQFDLVVLDGGGLELFGDALFHVARRLPNLQKTLVRLVVDRIGVDARPSLRLRREDLLDGAYSSSPSSVAASSNKSPLTPIGRIIPQRTRSPLALAHTSRRASASVHGLDQSCVGTKV